ncbi:MAG: hypothetical protein Q4G68_08260 [Planctomycetia bacterium]|nr:hypothetical protein [Planctomycetia bacterium]
MKRIQFSLYIMLMVVPSFFIACGGAKRPDGMPQLVPCQVTLTSQGQPVAGVSITLIPKQSGLERWSSAGLTDASGTAALVTYGQYKGVPSGEFKVVLGKTVTEGGENDTETTPLAKREAISTFSLVDVKYIQEATTPLELKVENRSVAESFEIGPEVKVLIDKFIPGKSL